MKNKINGLRYEILFAALKSLDAWLAAVQKEDFTFSFYAQGQEEKDRACIPFFTRGLFDASGNTSIFCIGQKTQEEELAKIKKDALKKAIKLALHQRETIKNLIKDVL